MKLWFVEERGIFTRPMTTSFKGYNEREGDVDM